MSKLTELAKKVKVPASQREKEYYKGLLEIAQALKEAIIEAVKQIVIKPEVIVNSPDVNIPETKVRVEFPKDKIEIKPIINYQPPELNVPETKVSFPPLPEELLKRLDTVGALPQLIRDIKMTPSGKAQPVVLVDPERGTKYKAQMTAVAHGGEGGTVESELFFPKGSTSDGTVALASADVWYAVPATASTKESVLIASIENAAGTIRWSFDNGGTPSATNGNLMPEHLSLKLGANKTIFVGSDVAGDDICYTFIEKE